MKPHRFVLTVLMLLFLGTAITQCGTNAIGGNDKAEWTEAVSGLQCRLLIQKNEYALGEPIIVDFELRNASNKTLLVYQGYTTEVTTSFDIRDHNGKKLVYCGYASGLGTCFPTILPGNNYQKGHPGQYKYGESFDIATEYAILKSGRYKVTALFRAGKWNLVEPKVEAEGIDVWSGVLKSNTIKIDVTEAVK